MKIGLTGTMSVGKTTLVNDLKQLPIFKEYEFRTERSKYLRDLGIPLNTDSTLKGQTIFLAERCTELMYENIITDRTVIDVMAFTKASKSISLLDKEKFIDYARQFIKEYDVIFYLSPEGIKIEDNGVRETDAKYRNHIDFVIRLMISQNRHRMPKFVPIYTTDREERIDIILNNIQNIIDDNTQSKLEYDLNHFYNNIFTDL